MGGSRRKVERWQREIRGGGIWWGGPGAAGYGSYLYRCWYELVRGKVRLTDACGPREGQSAGGGEDLKESRILRLPLNEWSCNKVRWLGFNICAPIYWIDGTAHFSLR